MRSHDADEDDSGELSDSVLFWPIGQELFAKVVRSRLNRFLPDCDKPLPAEVRECVRVFSKVNWSLHEPPWRGLLLTQDPSVGTSAGNWRMRNEDRKQAVETGEMILRFQVGIDDLSQAALEDLKIHWYAMLLPRPEKAEVDAAWQRVATPLI